MTQPNANDSSEDEDAIANCPHEEVFGPHKVSLEEPIVDKGIGVDPFCGKSYRNHKGPPLRLSKA